MSQVTIETSLGAFRFRLFEDRAPKTCAHFLRVIRQGDFDNASVFRIVTAGNHPPDTPGPIEVIQLGPRGCIESTHEAVPHENTATTGLTHRRGTVSAARVDLNRLFGSFFVCMRDEPLLDYGADRHPDRQGFAAFGCVESGFDTLERIMARAEEQDFLEHDIPILAVTIEDASEPDDD